MGMPQGIRPYRLLYINLHVKYGSTMIRTFWVKIKNMKKYIFFLYFKIHGHRGTKMSANAGLNTVEIYMYNKGKQLKTSFSYMGHLRVCGPLQWSDWADLAFRLSFHPYLCTCETRLLGRPQNANVSPGRPKSVHIGQQNS